MKLVKGYTSRLWIFLKSCFLKIIIFYLKLIFLKFLNRFYVLMLKVIFKNKNIYYFDIFSNKKYFKK